MNNQNNKSDLPQVKTAKASQNNKLSKKARKALLRDYRSGKISDEQLFADGIKHNDFDYFYAASRKNGLSRAESFYNALFVHSLRRFDKSKKHISDELTNTFSHPKGWYVDSFYTWKNNFWSKLLSVLQYIPRILYSAKCFFKKLPSAIASFFDSANVMMDNTFQVFIGLCKGVKKIAIFILPLICAVFMYVYADQKLNENVALDVYINGNYVGTVPSANSIISSKRMLEKNMSSAIGDNYRFTDEITYSFVSGEQLKYISDSELYSAMYSLAQKDIRPAYGLYVDGVLVAATENRSVLDKAVSDIKEYYKESVNFYAEKENIRVSYANEIKIVPKDFPVESLMEEHAIRAKLGLAPIVTEQVSYRTAIYEMYYKTIIEPAKKAQTQASKNVTGIGSVGVITEEAADVSTSATSPAQVDVTIDYVITRLEEVEEEYDYEIQRIESMGYLVGSEKLESFGKKGFRKAVYEVSYQNGEEISRELVSEEIIEPAQPRIIYVGIRTPSEQELATTATGTFILPYNGKVSSPYGLRTVSAFGTREFHNAWDIPGPYGSDILASDGGIVSKVGTTSGYGLYVMINHENGYETVYAHLSEALVEEGQRVGQGTVIAKMGASGRVTGVHVHLEIRKDGATIDPIEFIPDVTFGY